MREVTGTDWRVLRSEVDANIADSVELRDEAQRLRSVAMEERILSANDRLARVGSAGRGGRAVRVVRAAAVLLVLAVLAATAAGGTARGAGAPPSFTPCPPVKPAVRPAEVVIACGDGNFYVSKLTWSHWTATDASAVGTAHVNDCKPYCAAGHFHTYPLSLHLTRPRTCAHGRLEFTRFTYRFPAAKPAGVPRPASSRSGGTGCP